MERGKKLLVIEGKSDRKKIIPPGQLSSPGKKQTVASRLTLPALHRCWGCLQPPRTSAPGLSRTAQCSCGIGNLLWLRKIMGTCYSKPKKSQTKFRKRKKKVGQQLILLEKLLAFSFICHSFLWYFLIL